MTKFENTYLQLIDNVFSHGTLLDIGRRTQAYSTFHTNIQIDLLKEPFPILSCRECDINKSAIEMIGFMRGETNATWYKDRGYSYWNKYGLPADIHQQVRREDTELADEYCTDKGRIKGGTLEYAKRFKELNELGYEAGLARMNECDIPFYKTVLVRHKGDMGPIYGHLWRHWPMQNGAMFDQLRWVFDELSLRPDNRKLIINGWNPALIPDTDAEPHVNVTKEKMAIAPSHVLHEYYTTPIDLSGRVALYNKNISLQYTITINDPNLIEKLEAAKTPKYYLDLFWFQRDWDLVCDAPFNISGYALMLCMMAKLKNMVPRYVGVSAVNAHIHTNHIAGVQEMLRRGENKTIPYCKPKLAITVRPEVDFIDQFEPSDIKLIGYKHLDRIKFPSVI